MDLPASQRPLCPLRPIVLLLSILTWVTLASRAVPAQVESWRFVMFGQVVDLQGARVTFRTPSNQQGTVEVSPSAVFHEASKAFPSPTSLQALRPQDIFVLAIDAEQRTHVIIAHPTSTVERGWDRLFVRLVPGYTSVYPSRPPTSSPPPAAAPPQGDAFKVHVYGRLQGGAGSTMQVYSLAGSRRGQSMSVEVPSNATFHDTTRPPTETATASDLQVGDEVMLTSDSSDAPHVLFLHNGSQMSPAWSGRLSNQVP